MKRLLNHPIREKLYEYLHDNWPCSFREICDQFPKEEPSRIKNHLNVLFRYEIVNETDFGYEIVHQPIKQDS